MSEQTNAITQVETEPQRADLWTLLGEFHDWLETHVPHEYDPAEGLASDREVLAREPTYAAWIARHADAPTGCVLLYDITDDLAEFGRLWVRPGHRGRGIGRRLTRTVVEEARTRGHETIGLTTPPWSDAAHDLYESMGFERTPPYPETRLPDRYHDDAIFMQLDLVDAGRVSRDS